MTGDDFRAPRLYIEAPLEAGKTVLLGSMQAHYLGAVLRLQAGGCVLLFNGRDGEWSASIAWNRRAATLVVGKPTRAQTAPADLHYLFAPLKAARLDYTVQKAVEMGVSRLQPVLTRHTQVRRINRERMRANAIEAAEQCGVLSLPDIEPPVTLGQLLAAWDRARCLVFCDEGGAGIDPIDALAGRAQYPLAVLVGPEGGFAEDERAAVLELPSVVRLSLGPRVLRADTAAVAALALVQATCGDWRLLPDALSGHAQ